MRLFVAWMVVVLSGVVLTSACSELSGTPGAHSRKSHRGSKALKERLETARLQGKKARDIARIEDPALLVETLRNNGFHWLLHHRRFQWNLQWTAEITAADVAQITIKDHLEVVTDDQGQWRLTHSSTWQGVDQEPVKSGKRCGYFGDVFYLGSIMGPWSSLAGDERAAMKCLHTLGEPFADLISAFHSKALLTSGPGKGQHQRETVDVRVRGPERPEPQGLTLPLAWSADQRPTEAHKGPREHLVSQYSAVQSLGGLITFDARSTAPLQGELTLISALVKGEEKGRLEVSVRLSSSPWEGTLSPPDSVDSPGTRSRIFDQRRAVLGIAPRPEKSSDSALPKTGDGPRLIAREVVQPEGEDVPPSAPTEAAGDAIVEPQLEDRPE